MTISRAANRGSANAIDFGVNVSSRKLGRWILAAYPVEGVPTTTAGFRERARLESGAS
jgi:hypothetical protein